MSPYQIKEINDSAAAFAKSYSVANTEIDVEAMEVSAFSSLLLSSLELSHTKVYEP